MIVYLVHGFNVKDKGQGTTDKLVPVLAEKGDYQPVEIDYGFFGLFRVRVCNTGTARILASIVEPGSIAIGHSNGCAVIQQAASYGAKFRHVTMINPALDRDAVLEGADTVNVWHSPTDVPTRVSRVLWRHPWGAMGRRGPSFTDPRYKVFNEDHIFKDKVGHSGVFEYRHRLRRIVSEIEDRLFPDVPV
jgi:pimeloyl-ACP methyl ester carboxylesterase